MDKLIKPLLILTAVGLTLLMRLGFIYMLLALLPAMVVYFTDRDEGKPSFQVILACNLAGAMPALFPMLRASFNMQHYDISRAMLDTYAWLFIYTGAATGWGLIYIGRFLGRFMMTLYYQHNIIALESVQQQLVAEWGEQIKQSPGK